MGNLYYISTLYVNKLCKLLLLLNLYILIQTSKHIYIDSCYKALYFVKRY
jgi:hypothetical protein